MADDSSLTKFAGGMPGNLGANGRCRGQTGTRPEAAAGDRPTWLQARVEGSGIAVHAPWCRRERAPTTHQRKYLKLPVAMPLAVFSAMALMGGARYVAAEARQVEGGMITEAQPDAAGVRSFKGIPFAAPPVGALRWRAPQPVKAWQGERSADQFGPKCMQTARLGNIDPLNPRMSEDCLYLNIWTAAKSVGDRVPVMVWIYGGSFNVGAGSEPWYDGTNLAKKGVIIVTLNYRVDVFGFLSHPELTAESNDHASGNYGLMDQMAALGWVKRNIATFGGDPGQVTIFGESAGSLSVSALIASPLDRGLFQRAIGESGAVLYPDKSPYALAPLATAEQAGVKFADILSAHSIAELREKPAEELLDAVAKNASVVTRSRLPNIDGYVLPANAAEIFAKGQQNEVPLLAGSNADEGTLFAARAQTPTPESYTEQVRKFFGDAADAVLKIYPGTTPEQAKSSFASLLGDQLIAYPTWLWDELQTRTGKASTYRYLFELGELRQKREPERARLAGLAGLRGARRQGDAPCRTVRSRAGSRSRPIPGAQRILLRQGTVGCGKLGSSGTPSAI